MTQEPPDRRYAAAVEAYKSSKLAEAARLFGTLLLDPAFRGRAYYGLGLIFLSRKEPDKADDAFETAVKLGGETANALFYRGEIAERRGQQAHAVQHYRAALAIDPDHRGALTKLHAMEPMSAAQEPAGEARAADRTSAASPSAAEAERRPNETEDSQTGSEFIRRLQRDPSDVAQRLLGVLHSIRGDYRVKAIGCLDALLATVIGKVLKPFELGLLVVVAVSHVGSGFLSQLDRSNVTGDLAEALGIDPPAVPLDGDLSKSREVYPWLFQHLMTLYLIVGLAATAIALHFTLRDFSNRRYVVNHGRLRIYQGAARQHVQNVEIYRITDISEQRGFLAQLTGHATLRLIYQDALARPVAAELVGLPDSPPFQRLTHGLREAVLMMRSIPYLKGVIE